MDGEQMCADCGKVPVIARSCEHLVCEACFSKAEEKKLKTRKRKR